MCDFRLFRHNYTYICVYFRCPTVNLRVVPSTFVAALKIYCMESVSCAWKGISSVRPLNTAQRWVKIPHQMQKSRFSLFPPPPPFWSVLVSIYIVIICMLSDRLVPSSSPLAHGPGSQLAFPLCCCVFLLFPGRHCPLCVTNQQPAASRGCAEKPGPQGLRENTREMLFKQRHTWNILHKGWKDFI